MADERYLFLCGAEMDPTVVRRAYPAARFVARVRPADGGGGEVWGILLRTPAGEAHPRPAGDRAREVITDDGRHYQAEAPAGWHPGGEPTAILAAARYWELPPAYVRGLAGSATTGEG